MCVAAAIVSNVRVSSLSPWAPAMLGPYAQSIAWGALTMTAGTIGLQPETMKLVAAHASPSLQASPSSPTAPTDSTTAQARRRQLHEETVQTMRNVAAVLDASRSSIEALLELVVFVVADADATCMSEVSDMELARRAVCRATTRCQHEARLFRARQLYFDSLPPSTRMLPSACPIDVPHDDDSDHDEGTTRAAPSVTGGLTTTHNDRDHTDIGTADSADELSACIDPRFVLLLRVGALPRGAHVECEAASLTLPHKYDIGVSLAIAHHINADVSDAAEGWRVWPRGLAVNGRCAVGAVEAAMPNEIAGTASYEALGQQMGAALQVALARFALPMKQPCAHLPSHCSAELAVADIACLRLFYAIARFDYATWLHGQSRGKANVSEPKSLPMGQTHAASLCRLSIGLSRRHAL